MMSDEHGRPERATGAQGAEDLADGVSPDGSQGAYSAAADWGADRPDSGTGDAPAGFTAGTGGARDGFSAGPAESEADHGAPADSSEDVQDFRAGPGDGARLAGDHHGSVGEASASAAVAGSQVGAGSAAVAGSEDEDEADDDDADDAPAGRKRRMSGWIELPILIVVALTIALVIKTFVVQPFFIPSSSMEDTLLIGDKVLVNKLVYDFRSIQPGDIIVFNGNGSWNANPPPAKPASNPFARAYDATLRPLFRSFAGLLGTPVGQTDYVKRVIGVPGDRVACCNAQGLVTVNGVPLHEQSYLYPGSTPSAIRFNVVVPRGRLWVMGDNRAVSDDSRLRRLDPGSGTIPENKVIGRAFVIIWPPSRWRILPIPSTFNQPGINKPGSAAAEQASSAAAAQLLGAQVRPEAPYLPLVAGAVGAVPLTWLQRRTRRRAAERLRLRRQHRHS